MLWWWRFAFASGMTDALLVGKEREFLSWFYRNNTFNKVNFDEETLAEYYRTFQGKKNINGAFGVYRAIFETIDQTEKGQKESLLNVAKTFVGLHEEAEEIDQPSYSNFPTTRL